jgi:hypothetical protein
LADWKTHPSFGAIFGIFVLSLDGRLLDLVELSFAWHLGTFIEDGITTLNIYLGCLTLGGLFYCCGPRSEGVNNYHLHTSQRCTSSRGFIIAFCGSMNILDGPSHYDDTWHVLSSQRRIASFLGECSPSFDLAFINILFR